VSIQADLQVNPVDVLYCQQESLVAQDYQFIEKIDIPKAKIAEKLDEIVQKIFQDIKVNYKELIHDYSNPEIEAISQENALMK